MSETNKTLLVKCLAHTGYRRAGLVFTKGNNEVALDKVTPAQLAQVKADARLLIIESEAAPSGDTSGPVAGGDNVLSLVEAIKQLDPENSDHFTSGGKPQVDALSKLVGAPVSAASRDEAWAEVQAQAQTQGE